MAIENDNSIILELQRRRNESADLLESRKREIENLIPEIKILNKKITANALALSKEKMKKVLDQNAIDELEGTRNRLIYEKNDLLIKNGVPENYLKPVYTCAFCKDRGYLENGKQCNCVKQLIINKTYSMSNIGDRLEYENFQNFDIDIFSDDIIPEEESSQKDRMFEILTASEFFVYNFLHGNEENKNLLFYGRTGLGKSFLCSCIAKEIMDSGYTVIYQTSFTLMEIIEKYRFNRRECTPIDEANFRSLFECDLLIIDDLGTEMANSFTTSELFNILNDRIINNKKIIISTNIDILDMGSIYSDRILSRILGYFSIHKFIGKDRRFK